MESQHGTAMESRRGITAMESRHGITAMESRRGITAMESRHGITAMESQHGNWLKMAGMCTEGQGMKRHGRRDNRIGSNKWPSFWASGLLCVMSLALASCGVLDADAWRASPYDVNFDVSRKQSTDSEQSREAAPEPAFQEVEPSPVQRQAEPDMAKKLADSGGLADLFRSDSQAEPSEVAATTSGVSLSQPTSFPKSTAGGLTDTGCPLFGVLDDAARQRKFLPGAGGNPEKIVYTARITKMNGRCLDDPAHKFEVAIEFSITRGPAADPDGALVRYVLGLVDGGDGILSRDTGSVLVPWSGSGATRLVTVVHRFSGPIQVAKAGQRRVTVGILLHEHELKENRSVLR